MTYRDEDPDLYQSTNKWMAWGAVLLFLFVLAFPVYWLVQPAKLEAAQEAADANYAMHGEGMIGEIRRSFLAFDATGGIGPALNSQQFLLSVSDKQMHHLISTGVPGTLMGAYSADFNGPFTQQQITGIVKYLRSFQPTAPDFPQWHSPLAQTDLDGGELYAIGCSFCHGIDLEGNVGPPLGAGSDAAFSDDAFLEERIREGIGEMPAFGRVFTDDQIESIIDFLREEQGA